MNSKIVRYGFSPRRSLTSLDSLGLVGLAALLAALVAGCTATTTGVDPDAGAPADGSHSAGGVGGTGGTQSGTGGTGGTAGTGGTKPISDAGADAHRPGSGGTGGSGGGPSSGSFPAGWLFTKGNKIYASEGNSASHVWVGRGVNTVDLFLCGNNAQLGDTSAEQSLKTMVAGIMSSWKPTFFRVSLAMHGPPSPPAPYPGYKTVSWLKNPSEYKTPMTNVINAMGSYPNVYVLVTVRSDASMIANVSPTDEATFLPSDATTSPDKSAFPTGTDALYVALVDTFANAKFVMFGVANEPGGNRLTRDQLTSAMQHAVSVIRAEEDRLGVPHHLVAVQGNGWTSDISFYATNPIASDNVVYEVHSYPPPPNSYTFANLPVIIGEYGGLDTNSAPAFYTDIESKQIPSLAWDFDPFSGCGPDLVNVTHDPTKLEPNAWGSIVKSYLLAHAP